MTNELAGLESQKLTTSSHDLLTKTENAKLSAAVLELSLAKNIKLMDGTVMVWSRCLKEDIDRGMFSLDNFIDATKKAIRRAAYNRIDYSDLYKEALEINYKTNKWLFHCDITNKEVSVDELCGRIKGDICDNCESRITKKEEDLRQHSGYNMSYCYQTRFLKEQSIRNNVMREYSELFDVPLRYVR